VTDRPSLHDYLAAIDGCGAESDGVASLVSGQFHDVVLRGDVACRFPRDEESRRQLPARTALLSKLGKYRLPVAIPVPLSQAAIGEPLGRCYVAFSRLAGQPITGDRITGPGAESAVVGDLAELLDRLSELGSDEDVRAALPRSGDGQWRQFADEVVAVLFPLMSGRGRRRAEAELERVLSLDPAGEALVHGDLGGTNLLWSTGETGAPRLTGVLDWDGAQIGNQADDLASIAATFGWQVARRLDARRHAGQTPTIAAAEAITATFALQQALPAALSGDTVSLDDGLTAYRDPPGGAEAEEERGSSS
jgi:aminoglycoside phosphotransferase (APT) family kinase protein